MDNLSIPELAFNLREFTNDQLMEYYKYPFSVESRGLVRAELVRRGVLPDGVRKLERRDG